MYRLVSVRSTVIWLEFTKSLCLFPPSFLCHQTVQPEISLNLLYFSGWSGATSLKPFRALKWSNRYQFFLWFWNLTKIPYMIEKFWEKLQILLWESSWNKFTVWVISPIHRPPEIFLLFDKKMHKNEMLQVTFHNQNTSR